MTASRDDIDALAAELARRAGYAQEAGDADSAALYREAAGRLRALSAAATACAEWLEEHANLYASPHPPSGALLLRAAELRRSVGGQE